MCLELLHDVYQKYFFQCFVITERSRSKMFKPVNEKLYHWLTAFWDVKLIRRINCHIFGRNSYWLKFYFMQWNVHGNCLKINHQNVHLPGWFLGQIAYFQTLYFRYCLCLNGIRQQFSSRIWQNACFPRSPLINL